VILTTAVSSIEAAGAQAAQRTAALFVKRRAAQKRRPALNTEDLGFKRTAVGQAFGANRDTREGSEGGITNAAVSRVKNVACPTEKRPQGTGKRGRQPVWDAS